MKTIVYSTTSCPFCKMLKDYLTGKGIIYTEKLVDQDEASRNEMAASSKGFLGVPFTVVTKDDGSRETIMGFDKGKIDSLLGITG